MRSSGSRLGLCQSEKLPTACRNCLPSSNDWRVWRFFNLLKALERRLEMGVGQAWLTPMTPKRKSPPFMVAVLAQGGFNE